MTSSFLVWCRPELGGALLLGKIEAPSSQAAQKAVARMLADRGVSPPDMTLDVAHYQSIRLRNGVEVRISPIPSLEQRVAAIAQLAVG